MVEEENKRTARILEIIQLIYTIPYHYLRKDLAAYFEISERQIQKDIQIIRHGLKLPLEHARDGYYFEQMPRLPTLQYRFTEALALLLAVHAARQMSGVDSAELAAAIARLKTLFPPEFHSLLRKISHTSQTTAQREHRQQMLTLLNRALVEGHKIHICYETRSREGAISERTVRPYHLMLYVRSWQLIAYCEKREAVRMFKVDRIQKATLLDIRYHVPQDFDLDIYMGSTWGAMRGEAGEPEKVVLHFGPQAGRWVAEEHWHSSQQTETQPDGSIIFKLHVSITPEFVNWLLYYGDRVKVLQPEILCEKVAEAHRKALEIYE